MLLIIMDTTEIVGTVPDGDSISKDDAIRMLGGVFSCDDSEFPKVRIGDIDYSYDELDLISEDTFDSFFNGVFSDE